MRQTWDGVGVQKADAQPPPDGYEWLLEIADKAAPAVKIAFLEALRRARGAISQAALDDAVARADVAAAMRALGLDDLPSLIQPAIAAPLENAVIASGRETASRLGGVRIGMSFNLTNPNTISFLQSYDLGLIRQISDETREGIRRIITDAFRNGGHPYVQARFIRDSIGLTDDQAAKVQNFRMLLEGKDRAALTRALRDRRHDRTLDQALGVNRTRELSPDQIDVMVGRYRNRWLDYRAKNIARTETMRASNVAQRLAWGQAADKGLLDRATVRQFWLVTPDDRLCIYCAAVPDMNPDGVPLDGFFKTPLGPVMDGPLHPQCRCTAYIRYPGGGLLF